MALAQNATVFVTGAMLAPCPLVPFPGHADLSGKLSESPTRPTLLTHGHDPHRQRGSVQLPRRLALTQMPRECSRCFPNGDLHLCRGICLCFFCFSQCPSRPLKASGGTYRFGPYALCARINSSDSHCLLDGLWHCQSDDVSVAGGLPRTRWRLSRLRPELHSERVALLTVTIPASYDWC